MESTMSFKKLDEVIKNKGVNHSRAREAIFKLLVEEDKLLCVSKIITLLAQTYPKKISHNTLYRHLNFFAENDLVIILQDNYKRAYYCIKDDECKSFTVCPKCNIINKLSTSHIDIRNCDKDIDYITIHKKCKKCQSK